MTRVQKLLLALGWSQTRLATEVDVTQTTIWRLARGARESGPMRLALNAIAAEHGLTDLIIETRPAPLPDHAREAA